MQEKRVLRQCNLVPGPCRPCLGRSDRPEEVRRWGAVAAIRADRVTTPPCRAMPRGSRARQAAALEISMGVNDIVLANETPLMDIDKALTIAAWVYLNNLNTYYFILDKFAERHRPEQLSGQLRIPSRSDYRHAGVHAPDLAGHRLGLLYFNLPNQSRTVVPRRRHVCEGGVRQVLHRRLSRGKPPSVGHVGMLNDEPIRIGGQRTPIHSSTASSTTCRMYDHARCIVITDIKKLAVRPKAYDPASRHRDDRGPPAAGAMDLGDYRPMA